jgi:DNA polymerase III delta subunit
VDKFYSEFHASELINELYGSIEEFNLVKFAEYYLLRENEINELFITILRKLRLNIDEKIFKQVIESLKTSFGAIYKITKDILPITSQK